jgi:hypothetical protein
MIAAVQLRSRDELEQHAIPINAQGHVGGRHTAGI